MIFKEKHIYTNCGQPLQFIEKTALTVPNGWRRVTSILKGIEDKDPYYKDAFTKDEIKQLKEALKEN